MVELSAEAGDAAHSISGVRARSLGLIEALRPISLYRLLPSFLAALHKWPSAVAQLTSSGAITMQDESTLDNDGRVLKIIADLASPSATRQSA